MGGVLPVSTLLGALGGAVPGGLPLRILRGLARLRFPGRYSGAHHVLGLLEGLAHLLLSLSGEVIGGDAQIILGDVLGVPKGALGLVQRALDDLLHIFQQIIQLAAVPLVGPEQQLGQGLIGLETVEVLHQLAGVSQAVQRLLIGLLPGHPRRGQIQIAVVQVVGQFLDELGLGSGVGRGSQLAGHGGGKSQFHGFHSFYSSSMEISASSRARVFSHSRMFSSHCLRPASVME